MDINGSRFHLLFGKQDWQSLIPDTELPQDQTLAWDEVSADLTLHPLLFRFPTPPGDQLPRLEDRRGAARDRFGNWYWIGDDETEIRIFSTGDGRAQHFWDASDLATACPVESGDFRPVATPSLPTPLRLRGLAVTAHHYLVVGVLDPAGLLIFDLHAGGAPIELWWPAEIPFAPFDMSPALDGGVWILDRTLEAIPGRQPHLWRLDRYLRVASVGQPWITLEDAQQDDFQPQSGPQRGRGSRTFPLGISLDMASPLADANPVAIEALPDDTVLILDNRLEAVEGRHSLIRRYRGGEQLAVATLHNALLEFLDLDSGVDSGVDSGEVNASVLGHDMAFVPRPPAQAGAVTGTVYLVAAEGNQSVAFRLHAQDDTLTLDLAPDYFPMRLFSGKALVAAGNQAYYDLQERWVPLVKQVRTRYRTEGSLETPIFDGRDPNCLWHRLFIDACIPPGAQVAVESRTANRRERVGEMIWQAEPPLYRRAKGSELPYHQVFSAEEVERAGAGAWELLFQQREGRYLQLRLTLRGTGRNTPRLHALRTYYPRFSYLKEYLPAAYQDDPISASFLDRFLANPEGIYTEIEERIAYAQMLFDVRTVSADYLDWLASWFGVLFDPSWAAARRRLFLDHAIELFNQRGTPAGLVRAVRMAIDACPDDSLFTQNVLDASHCRSGTSASPGCYQDYNRPGKSSTATARFAHRSVRIVERFLTRGMAGVIYGDPTSLSGPGLMPTTGEWTPVVGAGALHQRYQVYLQSIYTTLDELNQAWAASFGDFDAITLAPVRPAQAAQAKDWRRFLDQELTFTYADVGLSDETIYQAFLARRYSSISHLNRAYQLSGAGTRISFTQIKLPQSLPSSGPRLADWIDFVSLVLPIQRTAHLFTVLVPTEPRQDRAERKQRLDLVRHIVEIEKPAHTHFDVKEYWALFRVGEVRLGIDTVLDVGSRFVALVLGEGYLADGFLSAGHPWNVPDRIVAGRDQVGSQLVL